METVAFSPDRSNFENRGVTNDSDVWKFVVGIYFLTSRVHRCFWHYQLFSFHSWGVAVLFIAVRSRSFTPLISSVVDFSVQLSPSAQLLVSHRLESYSSHQRVLSFSSIGVEVVPGTYTTLVCRGGVRKSWSVLCSCQFIHFRSHFFWRPGLVLFMFFPRCVQIERDVFCNLLLVFNLILSNLPFETLLLGIFVSFSNFWTLFQGFHPLGHFSCWYTTTKKRVPNWPIIIMVITSVRVIQYFQWYYIFFRGINFSVMLLSWVSVVWY